MKFLLKTFFYSLLISGLVQVSFADVSPDYIWSSSELVKSMNVERKNKSLARLSESVELNKIAEIRLKDMIENNYFAHASGTGKGYDELLVITDYDKKIRGENLAYGEFENENDIVSAWMNSKWHRYNILYGGFREVGTAMTVADFKGGKYIVAVQVFGVKKQNNKMVRR